MYAIVGTLFVFIFTLIFVYLWQKYSFWRSRGVLTPKFYPIIGHTTTIWGYYRWEKMDKLYKEYKNHGIIGLYIMWTPELLVFEPELCRLIMVKDADHFIDRRDMKFGKDEKTFSEMLTIVKGEKWKALRSVMTPTFTSGKIKSMFPLIATISDELIAECEEEMNKNSFVEIRNLFSFYTMDVIASCSFGIDTHCLKYKDSSQFIKSAKYMSNVDFKRTVKFLFYMYVPKLAEILGISIENEHLQFFRDVAKKTIDLRIKSGEKRGDFLDILLEAQKESEAQGEKAKYPVTTDTIISESILFLLAGYDTTSNTLSFLAYLLAKNSEAQDRLRRELKDIIAKNGQLDYQNVMEARYLDACLSETLRIYSSAHFIERLCTKTYKVPEREFEIPEGTVVAIPVYSLHKDPEFWEDSDSFKPERFFPENKENIKPYSYMPFGLGPRNCVGMRFAQLEAKIAIAKLVLAFKMEIRPGYNKLVLDKGLTTLRPNSNGVQLIIEKQ